MIHDKIQPTKAFFFGVVFKKEIFFYFIVIELFLKIVDAIVIIVSNLSNFRILYASRNSSYFVRVRCKKYNL